MSLRICLTSKAKLWIKSFFFFFIIRYECSTSGVHGVEVTALEHLHRTQPDDTDENELSEMSVSVAAPGGDRGPAKVAPRSCQGRAKVTPRSCQGGNKVTPRSNQGPRNPDGGRSVSPPTTPTSCPEPRGHLVRRGPFTGGWIHSCVECCRHGDGGLSPNILVRLHFKNIKLFPSFNHKNIG